MPIPLPNTTARGFRRVPGVGAAGGWFSSNSWAVAFINGRAFTGASVADLATYGLGDATVSDKGPSVTDSPLSQGTGAQCW